MKYKLVNYFDVWGDAKEGWTVNNQCYVGDSPLGDTFYLADDVTAREVLRFLVGIRFLSTSDGRRLHVDMVGDALEVYERKGMKPLCAFIPA